MIIQKQKIFTGQKNEKGEDIFYILKIVLKDELYHLLFKSELKYSGTLEDAEYEFNNFQNV